MGLRLHGQRQICQKITFQISGGSHREINPLISISTFLCNQQRNEGFVSTVMCLAPHIKQVCGSEERTHRTRVRHALLYNENGAVTAEEHGPDA